MNELTYSAYRRKYYGRNVHEPLIFIDIQGGHKAYLKIGYLLTAGVPVDAASYLQRKHGADIDWYSVVKIGMF